MFPENYEVISLCDFRRLVDGHKLDPHVFFSRKWPALAAKSHTRQKIIHNSVKTYDILMK